ncbi:hypothetical protein GCM10020219_063860 [Nonomuraea dietziae]
MRLIVIGNGMAGARLVSEVRARDKEIRVTVFGAETWQPYNRVLLSNVLAGSSGPDQGTPAGSLLVRRARRRGGPRHPRRPDRQGDQNGDRRGRPARAVRRAGAGHGQQRGRPADPRRRAGHPLPHPRRLPGDPGRQPYQLQGGRGRRRLLGIEAARDLAGRGLPVTLLHLAGHLMERQLDAEAGLVLGETLAGLGVEIRTGVSAAEVLPEGVRLADGTLVEGDLVVLACGVAAGDRAGRPGGPGGAPRCRRGRRAAHRRPAVFAIGECAEHDGVVYGLVAPAWGAGRRGGRRDHGHGQGRPLPRLAHGHPGSRPRAWSWPRWARPT